MTHSLTRFPDPDQILSVASNVCVSVLEASPFFTHDIRLQAATSQPRLQDSLKASYAQGSQSLLRYLAVFPLLCDKAGANLILVALTSAFRLLSTSGYGWSD